MTDKELIELAAKAYGFGDPEGNFVWTESEYPRGSKANGALWNYVGWRDTAELWNPLTDDGDALRLADHLDLIVDFSRFAAIQADRFYLGHRDFAIGNNVNEAITRAAAHIGKEME